MKGKLTEEGQVERQNSGVRRCPVCNKLSKPHHEGALYCSDDCQKAAQYSGMKTRRAIDPGVKPVLRKGRPLRQK
jgi:hypothetical protein